MKQFLSIMKSFNFFEFSLLKLIWSSRDELYNARMMQFQSVVDNLEIKMIKNYLQPNMFETAVTENKIKIFSDPKLRG